MLMVGVMGVLLMLSLMAICVAGYLVAVHHARNAADLAALSGAARYAAGADACQAARHNADTNGARVTSCGQVGDLVDFVITVQVEVTVRTGVIGLPTTVKAVAYAGAGAP
jgi:secretion/DNA translocation related TadE-like protein